MDKIKVEKPDEKKLEQMGVRSWPIWEKEVSRFDWTYDEQEVCFFLEGKVKVEPEGQDPVEIGAGDLVTFPQGMNCVWDISSPVKKHYKFG